MSRSIMYYYNCSNTTKYNIKLLRYRVEHSNTTRVCTGVQVYRINWWPIVETKFPHHRDLGLLTSQTLFKYLRNVCVLELLIVIH